MSLNHILNSINNKTAQQIQSIHNRAQKEKEKIIEEAKANALQIKQKAQKRLKEKAERKIQQANRKARIFIKHQITEKKREIINLVFEKAVKKIAKQQEVLFRLYETMLKSIPTVEGGEIITTEESLSTIQALAQKYNLAYPVRAGLEEEGFIFNSKTLEIDNRLSVLIRNVRDEAEVEIAKMLFGN